MNVTLVLFAGILMFQQNGEPEKVDYNRHFLGFEVVDLSDVKGKYKERKIKSPNKKGAVVSQVTPYSPVYHAGMRTADLILEVSGKRVVNKDEANAAIKVIPPGKEVPIKIYGYRKVSRKSRKFRWKTITIKVASVTHGDWLFGMLRTDFDEVEKVSIHSSKFSPESRAVSSLYLKIREEPKKKPELFVQIQYFADDWLFVKDYTLSIDGEKKLLKPEEKMFRDNSRGSVWEWQTISVNDDLLKTLKLVAESKKTILRYNGSDFYKDRTVSEEEKTLLTIMLSTYDAKVALYKK